MSHLHHTDVRYYVRTLKHCSVSEHVAEGGSVLTARTNFFFVIRGGGIYTMPSLKRLT